MIIQNNLSLKSMMKIVELVPHMKEKKVLAQKLWDDYLVLDISNSFKKKYSSSG